MRTEAGGDETPELEEDCKGTEITKAEVSQKQEKHRSGVNCQGKELAE